MNFLVGLNKNSYNIVLENGSLDQVDQEFDLQRKILLVTDDGVPKKYIEKVAKKCENPTIAIIPQGESNKNFIEYKKLLYLLLDNNFSRSDAIIAIGGGMVGDLAGFLAASYMRGIDFYNIPTTLLSQLDSSVGGKTAINFGDVKNIVGAFHQPKKVLIDPEVLITLSAREINSGLAEAIKMAACSSPSLFSLFSNGKAYQNFEEIIKKCLQIKISIVEKDEREAGLRKILNFGHTVGHAIESQTDFSHGESVAIGMLYFCSDQVKIQLMNVFRKYNLPTKSHLFPEDIYQALIHDKKVSGNEITIVYVPEIGKAELESLTLEEIKNILIYKADL